MYKSVIFELIFKLDSLSSRRSPLFRKKTSELEMRIGKRKRFTGKRVDVVRGGFRRVGKDFGPIAAGKNTFRALSIDLMFSRASEKTDQTFTPSASFQFQ